MYEFENERVRVAQHLGYVVANGFNVVSASPILFLEITFEET